MKINDDEIPNIFQLKVKSKKNTFWFLNWIDGVCIIDEIKYADFHFINKKTPDDKFNKFQQSCKVIVKLEFSLTSFFSIGCIFDECGRLLYFPEGINYDCDVINIDKDNHLKLAKGEMQNINENLFYPFPSHTLIDELYYYTTTINVKNSNIKIIIPVLAICNYLYFKSVDLTESLMSNDWMNLFSFREVERDNSITGYFEYDNSKILNSEIKSISQFFYLKDSLGLRSINLIGNHLKRELIENKSKNIQKNIYLKTVIPFSAEANFKLRGKIINHKSQNYFFAYVVENIDLNSDLFTIDKLILVPRFPEIQYLENRIKYLREKQKRHKRKLYKDLIEVKNYNGTFSPMDFFLKNSCLDFGLNVTTQMSDDELITIHKKLYLNNDKVINLKSNYLFLICESLINELSYLQINFVAINHIIINKKETIIVVNGLNFSVVIIEINYQNNFFYLIDFLRNYIGLISCEREHSKITPLTLKIFIHKIIYEYFRLPDFYIWFKIKEDKSIFIQDFGIDVLDYIGYEPKNIYSNDNKVCSKVSDIKQKIDKLIKKPFIKNL
jgi:hypothetical protein